MEQENTKNEEETEAKTSKKVEKMDKIVMDKLKGRVIIFNAEDSEFAKNLKLSKKGDYVQKKN